MNNRERRAEETFKRSVSSFGSPAALQALASGVSRELILLISDELNKMRFEGDWSQDGSFSARCSAGTRRSYSSAITAGAPELK